MIIHGDCIEEMAKLPAESVHCIVTSPPYWQHRKYGSEDSLIGLEATKEEWASRVAGALTAAPLREDGVAWVVVGDRYEEKNLLGLPYVLAREMQSLGWLWRGEVIWSKPQFVGKEKDRPLRTHEPVLLFSKIQHHFFDVYGILDNGKLPTSVWRIAVQGYGGHPAVYPLELARRLVLGGSPLTVCSACSAPRVRAVRTEYSNPTKRKQETQGDYMADGKSNKPGGLNNGAYPTGATYITTGFNASCECGVRGAASTVLDPFAGSGTTLVAAKTLGRNYVGIEINSEYVTLAKARIAAARAPTPALDEFV